MKIGGRGWDCNQFLLKDPKANAYDLVDAGHGLDFDAILKEVAAVTDPHRIRKVAITHEHLDHVNGLPKWQALGAQVCTSPATADKLHRGHDPTSQMFGQDIVRLDVDEVLADGDDILLGDDLHKVLLTPGHSPGSCCFWHEGSGTLYSGDTLFANGGIGRFDFPDGDLRQLAESVHRLGALPVQVLHCGHGPSVEADTGRHVKASMAHVDACLQD